MDTALDQRKSAQVGLEALYSISSTVNASLDLDEVLHHALTTVLDLFQFPCGVLRRLDPPTGRLSLTAHAGLSPELERDVERTVRVGDSISGLAVERRALVIVDDLAESPHAGSPWACHGYRTFVCVPLMCREMVLGCLNMAAPRLRSLDADERQLLTAAANQIGMAIANAELYAGAQRKIESLSALHQCSQDLGPAPDLDRVLQVTAERMAHLLRLERVLLLSWVSEREELVGTGARGFSPEAVNAFRGSLEELPLARSVLTDRHAVVSDAPVTEGLVPSAFGRAARIGGALAVPLVAHDEVLGLLLGDRGEQSLYLSSDEMELAMIFANQASVWIANARHSLREQAARLEAEAAQARFRGLLESAPDGIVIVDGEGRIALLNTQAERLFGYRREELLGQPVETLMPERSRGAHVVHQAGYLAEPRTRPMGAGLSLLGRRKDGSEFPLEISLSPMQTEEGLLVISVIRDITERRRADEERAQLLAREQKKSEQLKLSVREAHHRIKNNLQAISDLLYLELAAGDTFPRAADDGPLSANRAGSPPREAVRESMERIQAIALVHDLLSQDEDVRTVDIRAVVERLVPMVLRSTGASAQVEFAVPPIPLSSKKATTLALILNELVSNALKHAFSERRSGRLQIRLEHADEGLRLQVQDDGPGLPADFDLARHANVGLQVVRTLAERDLGGKLVLTSGPGLVAQVWFPW